MKKLVVCLLCLVCFQVFAEYQVYTYKATVKRQIHSYSKQDNEYLDAYSVGTDTLEGFLVTVCCYPCGADYGKSYPSWLYIKSSKSDSSLPNEVIWKMQVCVSGGVFGSRFNSKKASDMFLPELNPEDIKYFKRVNKCWFAMQAYPCSTVEYKKKTKGKEFIEIRYGLLGELMDNGRLEHTGFGSASYFSSSKKTEKWYETFRIYIKDANGTITGAIYIPEDSSTDPSNQSAKCYAPVTGTFSVKYNSKMTEKIRGIADWDKISEIIYNEIKDYKEVVADPDRPDLEDTEFK